jgi:parallel beta-helix repeat protein
MKATLNSNKIDENKEGAMPNGISISKFIIMFILYLSAIISISHCQIWSGERFTPDTHTFRESTWRLYANCENPASMYKYVEGPCLIKFKWRKSISYGSAFEFSMLVRGTKIKLICPSLETWNEESVYISDNLEHEIIWTYEKKIPIEHYCNMDSSAWLKDVIISNCSSNESILPMNISSAIANRSANITNLSNLPMKNPLIAMNPLNLYINSSSIVINMPNNMEEFPVNNSERDKSKEKSSLIVRLLNPEDGAVLPLNAPIEFNFTPLNSTKIPLCTWLIDDTNFQERNISRNINPNNFNKFTHIFNEIGNHSWSVNCCDCHGKCNSSNKVFFYVAQKNKTVYVNKYDHIDKFVYSTINEAFDHVTEGGTVQVEKGTYKEQVRINIPSKLIGSVNSVIDLSRVDKCVAAIEINSSNVEIERLRINNSAIGIEANANKELENIRLINNTISRCAYGIKLQKCSNICLINNNISNCVSRNCELSTRYDPNPIILIGCKNHYINGTLLRTCTKLDKSCENDINECL